jgi:toxin ParE1/3/4
VEEATSNDQRQLPCPLPALRWPHDYPEAERDLFGIWDFVWQAATAAVADKLLNEIDRVCFVLGAWPEYGRTRDDVREGLRSIAVSRYVVFYRVTKKAIEIMRVLGERRDVDTIFSRRGVKPPG